MKQCLSQLPPPQRGKDRPMTDKTKQVSAYQDKQIRKAFNLYTRGYRCIDMRTVYNRKDNVLVRVEYSTTLVYLKRIAVFETKHGIQFTLNNMIDII